MSDEYRKLTEQIMDGWPAPRKKHKIEEIEELLAFLESHILMVENRMRERSVRPSRDQSQLIDLSDRNYQMGLAVAVGKITGEEKETVIMRIQKKVVPPLTKKRAVKRAVKKKVVVRRKR